MRQESNELSRRAFLTTFALALASVLFCAMLAARAAYTGEWRYRFFVWNLFLAWIPFACAFFAYRLHHYAERHSIGRRVFTLAFLLCWLAFFPNAPYVSTDLIHWRPGVDFLAIYDLMMILIFIITGVVLGAVSLFLAHDIVEDVFGRPMGWLFAVAACAAAGFGIYLGRFLNWNSWDLLLNPDEIALDVLERVLHPVAHARTFAFTLVMMAFIFVVYVMVNTLMGTQQRRHTVQISETRI